jgi:hypothetical protein
MHWQGSQRKKNSFCGEKMDLETNMNNVDQHTYQRNCHSESHGYVFLSSGKCSQLGRCEIRIQGRIIS